MQSRSENKKKIWTKLKSKSFVAGVPVCRNKTKDLLVGFFFSLFHSFSFNFDVALFRLRYLKRIFIFTLAIRHCFILITSWPKKRPNNEYKFEKKKKMWKETKTSSLAVMAFPIQLTFRIKQQTKKTQNVCVFLFARFIFQSFVRHFRYFDWIATIQWNGKRIASNPTQQWCANIQTKTDRRHKATKAKRTEMNLKKKKNWK